MMARGHRTTGNTLPMRRALGLAALLIVLVFAFPQAGAQANVRRSFWGVEYTSPTSTRDFRLMHRAHVGTVRFVLWHSVVQANGWSPYDRLIRGLAKRRLQGLPDLLNNPANYTPPISGSAAQSWTQFAHAAVARYGPRGSFWHAHPGLPKKPLRAWQVGNEPSLPKYWPTKSPVRDYARFLKITHGAIKSARSHAKVVLAGLPGIVVDPRYRGWRFLSRLYGVSGVKRHFDIAAFQPYSHHVRDIGRQMRKYRRVMRRHGDKHTRVWITEFGYGSGRFDHRLNRGKKGQARMLRKTFRVFRHRRRHWNLRGVVWYEWRDPAQRNPDCSFCSSAGLLRSGFSKKPAYRAFKRIAH
jgi:hypothetical protein